MAALIRSPRVRRALRLAFGGVVVAGTIAVVGTGPLLRGLLAVSPAALVAATLLTAVATCAAAWRWRTVSSALGLPMSWPAAIAAYYRSQFVNTVLPGGVVGDVHRAYRHGTSSGALPIAARAVATERIAGQVVQAAVTVVVLIALSIGSPGLGSPGLGSPGLGSPGLASALGGWLPAAAWAGAAAALVGLVALVVALASARARRMLRYELSLLTTVFRAPRASLSIAAASVVVVAAHAGTFVVACLAVGIEASPRELVGLALIALAAASLPFNVGGWGPREAASATAFAAVGLGSGAGLAASTAFGILAIAALLPGAVVMIADALAPRIVGTPTLHPLPEERTA